ncbi:MAG: homocysteine S-methyltransferase family protein [Planctomycetes bacterium]|nr:homocysteine S-methyltransferase family protein [Planctomycetota bacterium]
MAETGARAITRDVLIVADGAWGTEVQRRGLEPGRSPEAWNIDRPAEVEAIARSYIEAGSRLILTNTFGANRWILGRYGLAPRAREINRIGAELSRRAAGESVLVFASMGPSGLLPSMDEIGDEELEEGFAEQAEALAEGGPDGIVIETMVDLAELRAAVRAAKRTNLPVAACMTFDAGPGRVHTMMGASVAQAVETAEAAGADIVGANCGVGMENYLEVCRQLRERSGKPVWIKPNAGIPEVMSRQVVYALTTEKFVEFGLKLAKLGANVIGGCCGTTPVEIRALAEALERA